MRTSYKILMNDEYNVLNVIASRTKMDCWFSVEYDARFGTDYVWDREKNQRLSLDVGIMRLVSGLNATTYGACQLNAFEDITFRWLLNKLGVAFEAPYSGPSIFGMSKRELAVYSKSVGLKAKKFGDKFVVNDNIYYFSKEGKCYAVLLDLKDFMFKDISLDEKIAAAEGHKQVGSAKVVFKTWTR